MTSQEECNSSTFRQQKSAYNFKSDNQIVDPYATLETVTEKRIVNFTIRSGLLPSLSVKSTPKATAGICN